MKYRLLLYCNKSKPYLVYHREYCSLSPTEYIEYGYETRWEDKSMLEDVCNGHIVAECDYEVEEIIYNYLGNPFYDFNGMQLHTKTLKESEISQCSKLNSNELRKYLLRTEDDYISPLEVGYAIHIKNLHIFDEPRELSDYFTEKSYKDINKVFTDEVMIDGKWYRPVNRAPQNMMRVKRILQEDGILISIHPDWLCKILNGEKTIEIRKKVLKEMLVNK